VGSRKLALAASRQLRHRPFLWLFGQEGIPKCKEEATHPQHHHLRSTPQLPKFDGRPDHRQDVAQHPSTQGGGVHLAAPQQRAAGWYLAPNHGNPGHLQRLQPRTLRIFPTLPHGLHPCSASLEGLPQCLERMGGAQPPPHHLALRPPWGSRLQKR